MVRILRENLIDPTAPSPSVEVLSHAFLPHRFVDHTHANAVLSLTNQPDGEAICAEVYGARAGIVPYLAPGFALAKRLAEVYEAAPAVEGKANEAVRDALAAAFGVRRRDVAIVTGERGRDKVVEVAGGDPARLTELLRR